MEKIMATQGRILAALDAINRLRKDITGRDALNLYRLKNKLTEYANFEAEEEQKLVDKYNGTIAEDGRVMIDGAENQAAFVKEYVQLREMECDIDAEKVKLSLDDHPAITMEDIEQLDSFVDFV